MTTEELKEAIVKGTIGSITLDTSIFDSNGLKLESGLLERMEQFRGSGVQFVLSEVVINEVVTHLTKGALEAQRQLETAYKGLEKSWLIAREKLDASTAELLQGRTIRDLALSRVNSFIERTGCQNILVADHVDVSEMLRRYFVPQPPFSDKEKKKNEFPDALALLSLESWAKKSGKKILAVSKDGDWIRYCQESDVFVYVEDLGIALSLFHRDASVACNLISLHIERGGLSELHGMIEQYIFRHVDRIDIAVDAESSYWMEDEVTDYEVEEVILGSGDGSPLSLEPIDAGEGYLVAELPVSVEIRVECDFQFFVKDGIDKDYMSIGSTSVRRRIPAQFEVLVTFGGAIPESPVIESIDIVGATRLRVAFGHVEPDWDEDPNSEFY